MFKASSFMWLSFFCHTLRDRGRIREKQKEKKQKKKKNAYMNADPRRIWNMIF